MNLFGIENISGVELIFWAGIPLVLFIIMASGFFRKKKKEDDANMGIIGIRSTNNDGGDPEDDNDNDEDEDEDDEEYLSNKMSEMSEKQLLKLLILVHLKDENSWDYSDMIKNIKGE